MESAPSGPRVYTAAEVSALVGVYPNHLQHWLQLGLLRVKSEGQGRARRFAFSDLVEAQLIAILDGFGLQCDAIEHVLIHWRKIVSRWAYKVPTRHTINRARKLRATVQRVVLELQDIARAARLRDQPNDAAVQDTERRIAQYCDRIRRVLSPATRERAGFVLAVAPPDAVLGGPFPDLTSVPKDEHFAARDVYFTLPNIRVGVSEPREIDIPITPEELAELRKNPTAVSSILYKVPIPLPSIPLGSIQIDLRAVFEKLEAATGDRWPADAEASLTPVATD